MEIAKSQSDKTWDSEVEKYKELNSQEKSAHDTKLDEMDKTRLNSVCFTDTEALTSSNIHPTATIEEGTRLGRSVQIGRSASIHKGARLGNMVRIGDFAEVGSRAIMEDFSHALNEAVVKPREVIPRSGVRPNPGHKIV